MEYIEVIEEEKTDYMLHFEDACFPGSGYSFPCDKCGRILWDIVSHPAIARKSLAYCKAHQEEWTADSQSGKVVQNVCHVLYLVCPCCGRRVYFGGSEAAECKCGRWYSAFGKAINPPENYDDGGEWEEEEDYLTF